MGSNEFDMSRFCTVPVRAGSLYSGPRLLSYGVKYYADDAAGLHYLASDPATAACEDPNTIQEESMIMPLLGESWQRIRMT